MPEKIVQGDLLYHSVHGLCRVNEVIKQNPANKDVSYSIVPKLPTHMKVRFVVSKNDIQVSGFHSPVSLKEANKILEFLKKGDKAVNAAIIDRKAVAPVLQENETWALAKAILTCSQDKSDAKDQRKRQMLERSARGLVRELAFVMALTVKETITRVRRSLAHASKINPLVLAALTQAADD